MQEQRYCKRLIEVDLPIKKISEHARREKSIRHGHISTLHIWWARRPLAACRAVLCASLWPDPVDPFCPDKFKKESASLMKEFRNKRGGRLRNWDDPLELRQALLNFIADFSDWKNAFRQDYLDTARALVRAAYGYSNGFSGSQPLVVDSFAGGGAIPLEALRVGADAFSSDLNPVAVLLNKVIIEYGPKYGQRLVDEVKRVGDLIKKETESYLGKYYPKDKDGSMPIAYLWARTISCEGPGCGAEIPLIRSLWVVKKSPCFVALRIIPNMNKGTIAFAIDYKVKPKEVGNGTVVRGAATCPLCNYTTSVKSVRRQLISKNGGANESRLILVINASLTGQGKSYRIANEYDVHAFDEAKKELKKRISEHRGKYSLLPNEEIPLMSGVFNVPLYGHKTWDSLFNYRQALILSTLANKVAELEKRKLIEGNKEFINAVKACLAIIVDRCVDKCASLVVWDNTRDMPTHVFGRQALGMVWDYAEANPLCDATGGWNNALAWVLHVLESCVKAKYREGHVQRASALEHPLPDDSTDLFFIDPPYYNSVPYADLSDYFYVWLKRMLGESHPELFSEDLSPKANEICEMSGWDPLRYSHKDKNWYQAEMQKALVEGRRILKPSGIGVIVFAHTATAAWEAQLSALIDAGWIVTGSWPIDTEMANRLRAQNSAALASSVHIVCRPRENVDGAIRTDRIGDWRDVLAELPHRIHEWMPRLASEGVVGADAIFACLGPAIEVFSKYSCVEKASGEKVELREYLEQVWGAVAKEALNMIFQGAHTEEFEEDARLTAIWLWTLSTTENDIGKSKLVEVGESQEDDDGSSGTTRSGYSMEYDAARKIAQGLGAHLETLESIIEIKGETACLLHVAERVKKLFGKGSSATNPERKKKKEIQKTLFEEFNKVEDQGWSLGEEKSAIGKTVLDRLHQAMILFGAGRSDALRRFLVEEGIGKDERFWRLAQALSALYPSHTDEKRWVDGVLARKKSLGF